MKKIVILLLIPYFLFSQEMNEYKTDTFIFSTPLSISYINDYKEYIEGLDIELNKVLSLKNSSDLREIVIFEDQNSYNKYLDILEIPQRDDFIFLKFSDNRTKVVLYKSDFIDYSNLAHHLTLQYINFYGGNTPKWFNTGIATYFEDYRLNIDFSQSNKWVYTLKESLSFDTIYTQVIKNTNKDIKPYYSWIIIDYLISTENKEHNRLFWDSLSLLRYKEGKDKSNDLIKLFQKYNLNTDIYNYILSKKGYKEYMDLGIDEYQKNNFDEAILNFKEAILIEPDNYSPEYYLGMCFSNLKKYNEAYSHFSISLDKGASKDIVYYSIGVNFYNNKDFIQAKKYLNKIDDKMYQVMAEKILNEISKY